MSRRLAVIATLVVIIGCGDITAPVPEIEYALDTVDGVTLPITLVTDYDITVALVSDVIRMRTDSTFLEIAEFRGVSAESQLTARDSVAGTYTVTGSTIYFLTTSARAARMSLSGDLLTENAGRQYIYRRR